MQSKATILLAEDDQSLAFMIKDALTDEGYQVLHCPDGQSAIDTFAKSRIDICLLDIMMPLKDGYLVARRIRQQSDQVPIIFLSTKSDESDRLNGYDTGADDYISKPFSMQELLRKLEVFRRRSQRMHAAQSDEYHIGLIHFLPADLKVLVGDESVTITQKEAEILTFLVKHKNKVVKRDEVLLNVWGKNDYFLGRSMDVFMSKIRKILKADPAIQLETIHGMGFRLNVPENAEKKAEP